MSAAANKRKRSFTGAQIISGRRLLALAHAAKRARDIAPDWYASVRLMIHELRICNGTARHYHELFNTQSDSLFRSAKELCQLKHEDLLRIETEARYERAVDYLPFEQMIEENLACAKIALDKRDYALVNQILDELGSS